MSCFISPSSEEDRSSITFVKLLGPPDPNFQLFPEILTKLSTQRDFAAPVPLFVQNLTPSALSMPRLPERSVEEFAEDFRRTKKILRPNPDWEEDLVQTCEVTSEIRERVRTYSQLKKRKPRIECCCQEATTKPGVAPLIELNDGHTIPNLGLGTWLGFDKSGLTVEAKDDTVKNAVEIAIDAGYRLIDTAAKYTTEEQVRKGIEAKIAEGVVSREDLCIVTKLWNDRHAKKDVVPALKESLARLGLEYLDIYVIHFPVAVYDNNTFYDVDYLETWEGLIEAKALGLVKSIGVSNFNITQLDRLISMSKVKPAVLQIEVNLNLQEQELINFCKKHNIAVMAYTPFGSIFHNKAAKDAPPPRTDDQALLKIADRHHKTVAQINLRYLIELGVIPIPKSVTKKRIEANIEVFDFQLSHLERQILKKFDRNYRTLDVSFWEDSPYYPFKKHSIP